MRLVVDVNVVLSVLIRDSATRKMILESDNDLFFPEQSVRKIIKYKQLIMEKSGLSEKELLSILSRLFAHIRLVPSEEVIKKWGEAKGIMEHIDEEDVVFIATALSKGDSAVWSDDTDFDRQSKIKVLKTKDMVRIFLNY